MTNGREMLNDLEFENHIQELGDDLPKLVKFVARQQFEMSKELPAIERRVKDLEGRNNRFFGAVGGISGLLGAAFVKAIDYFITRGQ